MSKIRDEFLDKQWRRYPEMPQRALRWGRVEQHYLGTLSLAGLKLIVERETEEGVAAEEILHEGDLVCLLPNNKVMLLAPNLTQRKSNSCRWATYKQWQGFLSEVRRVFVAKTFIEVRTPTLVSCPGTEPSLEVFETEFQNGSERKKFFLPTSPELNLKKLLAEGAEKIFELAPVFRNGESTDRHLPEFIMLEWYRAFANLAKIKMDVLDLIDSAASHLQAAKPAGVLTFSVSQLFKEKCGFDLRPETSVDELKELALRLGVDVKSAQSIDDYFYLIFMEKIEYTWPADHIVFVEKYPPYQAALARVGSDGWAERFEVYWKGYELGNAFHELNDPTVQRLRAEDDLAKKAQSGKKPVLLDGNFFTALEFGMPPSAGIAVGLERLYMALTDLNDISALRAPF